MVSATRFDNKSFGTGFYFAVVELPDRPGKPDRLRMVLLAGPDRGPIREDGVSGDSPEDRVIAAAAAIDRNRVIEADASTLPAADYAALVAGARLGNPFARVSLLVQKRPGGGLDATLLDAEPVTDSGEVAEALMDQKPRRWRLVRVETEPPPGTDGTSRRPMFELYCPSLGDRPLFVRSVPELFGPNRLRAAAVKRLGVVLDWNTVHFFLGSDRGRRPAVIGEGGRLSLFRRGTMRPPRPDEIPTRPHRRPRRP